MLIEPNVTNVPLALPREGEKEMLSLIEENGVLTVRVNYSSLSIMQECPRKAYYMLHRKLRGKSDSPATLFGSAIHKALEVFYRIPRENRNIPHRFAEYSDLMAHGHAAPTDHPLYACIAGFVQVAEPLRALPDEDKRSLSSGVWLLQHYFKTYINDPFEVYCDEEGPVVERRAELKIYEDAKLNIVLFGTIDCVLKNMQTGVILPTDHKTSSVVGNDFYNRLKPNAQYSGYFYLAQQVLKIQGDGFLVNCLQVKARPKTARGTPPDFPRQVTRRSPLDIEEFKESLVFSVKDYLRWLEANVWPMGSVNVCTFWGGCSFLDVCGAPHEIREDILANKFENTKGNEA